MLTEEKWDKMTINKRYKFISRHYPNDQETMAAIAEIIIATIETFTEPGERAMLCISMSERAYEIKSLPTWYKRQTKESYKSRLRIWLSANFIELFDDWEAITSPQPTLFDGEHACPLIIPGLFRLT